MFNIDNATFFLIFNMHEPTSLYCITSNVLSWHQLAHLCSDRSIVLPDMAVSYEYAE